MVVFDVDAVAVGLVVVVVVVVPAVFVVLILRETIFKQDLRYTLKPIYIVLFLLLRGTIVNRTKYC